MSLLQHAVIESGGYTINNSLRFRSSASAYLNRTPASAGNRKTWTYSIWFKMGAIPAFTDALFNCNGASTDATYFLIRFESSGALYIGNASTNFCVTSQLFRDPSAWYHLVIVLDTTQATATNRLKVYVNGVQVTSFSSDNRATQIALNSDQGINQASAHNIGRENTGVFYLDGYLSEVNFIDGQALTPSSFGQTDPVTGVWQAKKYTGTYGTNGFYLPFGTLPSATYAGSFSGSGQYLNLSAPSNLAFGTGDFTIEMWFYQNSYLASSALYDGRPSSTNGAQNTLYFGSNSVYYAVNGVDAIQSSTISNGQWYHLAVTRSGTSTKMFLNGVQQGSTYSDSTNYVVGTNRPMIGANGYWNGTYAFNGLISNLRVLKGTALYTSNFVPPSAALTSITNTQLLTLQNSTIIDNSPNAYSITNTGSVTTTGGYYPYGSSSLGNDSSGNGNNWATNNINGTTTGTTYDSMIDSPTNASASGTQPVGNYAICNPLNSTSNISDGNLKIANKSTSVQENTVTSIEITTPIYFEHTVGVSQGAGYNIYFGVGSSSFASSYTYLGASSNGWAIGYYTGAIIKIYNNSSTTLAAITPSVGDVFMIAVDPANGKIWFGRNGTWYGSGNPTTGANPAYTGLPSTLYSVNGVYYAGAANTNYYSMNYGQRPFSYTPPTGFKALCTTNLPDSTIVQGNKYMDATIYSGNSSTNTITNAGSFKPDFLWIKCRSTINSNSVWDTNRGVLSELFTNNTNAQETLPDGFTAFNSNGFSLDNSGSGGNVNVSGRTYVAWQWNANNGTTSSNTNGSITSTVGVNTTAGFSIVTYTGTGANATVGHGLGVAPKMVIVKRRDSSATPWVIYHTTLGAGNYVAFDTGASSSTTAWNSTTPTSTLISLGANVSVNNSGSTHVAYCFAEIAGFSKFGSYTGNGSADGPFIYTGFRPKFILYKSAGSADPWIIFDSVRNTYNFVDAQLRPNETSAENSAGSAYSFDFLSNGFKVRSTSTALNNNGGTMIYAAFAENPFKNSLAR